MLHPEHAVLARQVVHEYVHDPDAFTQGLEYDTDCSSGACKEVYWESTGALFFTPIHLHVRTGMNMVCDSSVPVSHRSRFFSLLAGMYGQSSVREVDLATGTVLRQKANAHSDFGEGLVKVGGRCGCHLLLFGKCLCSWVIRLGGSGRLPMITCGPRLLIWKDRCCRELIVRLLNSSSRIQAQVVRRRLCS